MKNLHAMVRRLSMRSDVRTLAVLAFSTAANTLSANPSALATALGTNGTAWLTWALRLLGGLMAIGGIVAAVDGFTGNEEGYKKTTKVGGGLILVAMGGYLLGPSGASNIIQALNLNNMFSAT